MIGNVWEWTSSTFTPYPGFSADAYADYSAPWFGTHRVLRGGCWATGRGVVSNTYRNFFAPDRVDVFAGLRTRSEEHTSELQSLMRISYAVFCLKKNTESTIHQRSHNST